MHSLGIIPRIMQLLMSLLLALACIRFPGSAMETLSGHGNVDILKNSRSQSTRPVVFKRGCFYNMEISSFCVTQRGSDRLFKSSRTRCKSVDLSRNSTIHPMMYRPFQHSEEVVELLQGDPQGSSMNGDRTIFLGFIGVESGNNDADSNDDDFSSVAYSE